MLAVMRPAGLMSPTSSPRSGLSPSSRSAAGGWAAAAGLSGHVAGLETHTQGLGSFASEHLDVEGKRRGMSLRGPGNPYTRSFRFTSASSSGEAIHPDDRAPVPGSPRGALRGLPAGKLAEHFRTGRLRSARSSSPPQSLRDSAWRDGVTPRTSERGATRLFPMHLVRPHVGKPPPAVAGGTDTRSSSMGGLAGVGPAAASASRAAPIPATSSAGSLPYGGAPGIEATALAPAAGASAMQRRPSGASSAAASTSAARVGPQASAAAAGSDASSAGTPAAPKFSAERGRGGSSAFGGSKLAQPAPRSAAAGAGSRAAPKVAAVKTAAAALGPVAAAKAAAGAEPEVLAGSKERWQQPQHQQQHTGAASKEQASGGLTVTSTVSKLSELRSKLERSLRTAEDGLNAELQLLDQRMALHRRSVAACVGDTAAAAAALVVASDEQGRGATSEASAKAEG